MSKTGDLLAQYNVDAGEIKDRADVEIAAWKEANAEKLVEPSQPRWDGTISDTYDWSYKMIATANFVMKLAFVGDQIYGYLSTRNDLQIGMRETIKEEMDEAFELLDSLIKHLTEKDIPQSLEEVRKQRLQTLRGINDAIEVSTKLLKFGGKDTQRNGYLAAARKYMMAATPKSKNQSEYFLRPNANYPINSMQSFNHHNENALVMTTFGFALAHSARERLELLYDEAVINALL